MGAERIVLHQLRRNLVGQCRIEPALDVDAGEFPLLGVRIGSEFPAFPRKISRFCIGL